MNKIREVRKRDNRIVPFDETKIADAIYKAFRSVGSATPSTAQELASAVVHFLETRFQDSIPGIEDIQDLVETVLMEVGHPKVAKAYILYRQKRAMLRETLEVRKVLPQGEGVSFDYADERSAVADRGELAARKLTPGESPATKSASEGRSEEDQPPYPEVEEALFGTAFWCKGKITAALIREADLDPDVAEDIASNVERKVLKSGIRRISTSLIRELVDNELFERGCNQKLEQQAPVALPKYNLEQIIFGTDSKEGYSFPKNPSEVREIVANRILHQYSLQQVFSPSVADAHRNGRIFLHRLSDPIRLARLRWDLPAPEGVQQRSGEQPLTATGEGLPGSWLDLGDFFRQLSHAAHYVSEEVRLTGLPNLLLDPATRSLRQQDLVRRILERLSQMGSRPDIALELDLDPSSEPWLQGLLELSRKRPRRFLASLRLRSEPSACGENSPTLSREALSLVAELYGRGELVEFLCPRMVGATPPIPGGRRVEAFDAPARPPWVEEDREWPDRTWPRSHGTVSTKVAGSRMPPPPGERRLFDRGDDSREATSHFTAVLAKTTINLPRAAYRSGKDRRASIEGELESIIDLAVKGHLERRQFVQRLGANRENPLWGLLGSGDEYPPLLRIEDTSCAIGLLGLNECIKFLTGQELHGDSNAASMAIELVRLIHEKLCREERGLGIRLRLEETANVGPLRVLEKMDRRLHPEMCEVDRGRHLGSLACYTDGVRLHRSAPVDPLGRLEEMAPFLPYVAPTGGVVEDFPELRGADREVLTSLLEDAAPFLCRGGRPAGWAG